MQGLRVSPPAMRRTRWVSVPPIPVTLYLEDCRIPAANLIGEEGKGFGIAMKTLDQARAWMGCVATGIAQRGINEAVAYGKERIQFGKPIIKNQALQFKVADMEIKTETARQMVAHALTKMDMGLPYTQGIRDREMLCIRYRNGGCF